MRNCAPYYHVIEDANYAAAIEFCSEDNTCAMFYQKKSSATDQGDEFYFCSADAEIKSDNTHDHLHVKCKFQMTNYQIKTLHKYNIFSNFKVFFIVLNYLHSQYQDSKKLLV